MSSVKKTTQTKIAPREQLIRDLWDDARVTADGLIANDLEHWVPRFMKHGIEFVSNWTDEEYEEGLCGNEDYYMVFDPAIYKESAYCKVENETAKTGYGSCIESSYSTGQLVRLGDVVEVKKKNDTMAKLVNLCPSHWLIQTVYNEGDEEAEAFRLVSLEKHQYSHRHKEGGIHEVSNLTFVTREKYSATPDEPYYRYPNDPNDEYYSNNDDYEWVKFKVHRHTPCEFESGRWEKKQSKLTVVNETDNNNAQVSEAKKVFTEYYQLVKTKDGLLPNNPLPGQYWRLKENPDIVLVVEKLEFIDLNETETFKVFWSQENGKEYVSGYNGNGEKAILINHFMTNFEYMEKYEKCVKFSCGDDVKWVSNSYAVKPIGKIMSFESGGYKVQFPYGSPLANREYFYDDDLVPANATANTDEEERLAKKRKERAEIQKERAEIEEERMEIEEERMEIQKKKKELRTELEKRRAELEKNTAEIAALEKEEIQVMEAYLESKQLSLDMDIDEMYEIRDEEDVDCEWYKIHPYYEWDEKPIGKWVFAPPFPSKKNAVEEEPLPPPKTPDRNGAIRKCPPPPKKMKKRSYIRSVRVSFPPFTAQIRRQTFNERLNEVVNERLDEVDNASSKKRRAMSDDHNNNDEPRKKPKTAMNLMKQMERSKSESEKAE